MLDVIIAYVVILLVLSTITTAILQLFQRMLPLRYLWLRHCLATLRQRFLTESRQTSTAKAEQLLRATGTNPLGQWFPDYVGGPTVRRWLAEAAPGAPLLEECAFEPWWKTFEKQMSASFRVWLVGLSIPVGFVLSLATGLEAVSVARHLSESPAEVEALTDDAAREAGGSRRKHDEDLFVRLVERELAARIAPEQGVVESAEQLAKRRHTQAQLLVCFDAFAQATKGESPVARAAAIELAVQQGTLRDDAEQRDQCTLPAEQLETQLLPAVETARETIARGLGFGGYPLTEDPTLRFFGQLLMALFIGLGAPFWFELLNLLRLPLVSRPPPPDGRRE